MHYTVSYANPLTKRLAIVVEVGARNEEITEIALPKWRPGRYELTNYPANIYKLVARSKNGANLEIERANTHTWRVKHSRNVEFQLQYDYYANVLDGGGSYLDERQLYLNPINFCVYIPSEEDAPCALRFTNLGGDHHVATSMRRVNNELFADSFHELVDSPIIVSKEITCVPYEVNCHSFKIWLQGKHPFDLVKLKNDFEKFTRTQLTLLPIEAGRTYHYLVQIVPYKFYHGVEHCHSTTIVIGPCDDASGELYENLIGVCSHELFHYWNVKRLRPKELLPYNYSAESSFNTGYVIEGFTTYYGDLFIKRGNVFDEKWYLKEIDKLLKKHFENGGRFNLGLLESSTELWVDGYKPGIPNRKVSIYNEGALFALMLDLKLREKSAGSASLDDLMKALWSKFYLQGKGYVHHDIVALASELAGNDVAHFFEKHVASYYPIEDELSRLLGLAGYYLSPAFPENKVESMLGIKYQKVEVSFNINSIAQSSPAELLLTIGDQLLEIGGEKFGDEIPEFPNSNTIGLKVKRFGEDKTVQLALDGNKYFQTYTVKPDPTANEAQVAFRHSWLNPPTTE